MNKIRPEYQKLISESAKVLNQSNFVTMRNHLETWSKHEDIQEEFFTRPGDIRAEDKISELSDRYGWSESYINKILYILRSA